ncbi:hypothetical protein SDC9_168845 [bioreactor metagenome]|uniref:Uncharacterized protein n=1 Tax=bioreactor metagenome TaxID=1076179 RepID=A0A645G486_9ZZZZ
MSQSGNPLVLRSDALRRVYDDKAYVSPFYGGIRSHYAVALDFILKFALTPDSCGIDKRVFTIFVFKGRVYRITCSSGDGRYDDTFFPKYAVHYRAFPGVRFPDYRHGNAIVVLLRLRQRADERNNAIKHIAGAGAMD